MGLMNYSEQQKAIETLKAKHRGCPNCHSQGAEISDIVGLPVLERGIPSGIAPGNQIMSLLPVTCRVCGCVLLFGAKEFVNLD